ncbi:MAG: hypothetical protein M1831_002451 [Alyxoria varia]|nr:MAG: hypothetical protein M1831_002451 [Alyxoria varia]
MSSDPFDSVHADLLNRLTSARQLLSSYTRISRTTTSRTSPELREARSELSDALSDLAADLQDLSDSVQAAEADPVRYNLTDAKVRERKHMVTEVRREVEGLRTQVARALEGPSSGSGPGSGGGLPDPSAFDEEGAEENDDAYAAFEQQRQEEIWAEQDEALGEVGRTVGNLRMQANEMGRELEEQGEMLGGVDHMADRVGDKLRTGIKRVEHIAKQNEGRFKAVIGSDYISGAFYTR